MQSYNSNVKKIVKLLKCHNNETLISILGSAPFAIINLFFSNAASGRRLPSVVSLNKEVHGIYPPLIWPTENFLAFNMQKG